MSVNGAGGCISILPEVPSGGPGDGAADGTLWLSLLALCSQRQSVARCHRPCCDTSQPPHVLPVTGSTGNTGISLVSGKAAGPRGSSGILLLLCCANALSQVFRGELVSGLRTWSESVRIAEAGRLGAGSFVITRPFCKSYTVGKNELKLHQEWVWLVGWLLTEG